MSIGAASENPPGGHTQPERHFTGHIAFIHRATNTIRAKIFADHYLTLI
jgi:hypothetical protein